MTNETNDSISVFIIGDGRMGTIIRELVEADEGLTLAGIVGIDTKETLRDQAPMWRSTFPIKTCCRLWRRISPVRGRLS